MNRRERIDFFQARFDHGQLRIIDELGLVQHDLIRKRDLFNCFAAVSQAQQDMLRIDERRDGIEYRALLQEMIDKEGLHHRPRIGKAGRLDDDRIEIAVFCEQAMQRADQVAAHGAADAAIVHFEQFFISIDDQVIVDADFAKLVDDDGIAMAMVFRQDAVQQRGLAGTEVSGQDRDRNAHTGRDPVRLQCLCRLFHLRYSHGISDAWITSGTPSLPTERIARSTSLRPNLCVVTFSSGKRFDASCASASSQAR